MVCMYKLPGVKGRLGLKHQAFTVRCFNSKYRCFFSVYIDLMGNWALAILMYHDIYIVLRYLHTSRP